MLSWMITCTKTVSNEWDRSEMRLPSKSEQGKTRQVQSQKCPSGIARVKSKDNQKCNNAVYLEEMWCVYRMWCIHRMNSSTCSFHDKWLLTCWRLALFNPSSKSLMEILVLLECYCSWRTHFSGEHYFGSRGDRACQRAHHDFLWCGDCGCSAAGCGGCRDHTSCRDLLLLFQPFLWNLEKKWNKGIISIFRFCNINIVSTHYWEIKASGRILV